MAKPITITVDDNGKETQYTLEFNKKVVRAAGEAGCVPEELNKQIIKLYDFFWYAFQMHHAGITRQKTDAIIDSWGGIGEVPEGLITKLYELWYSAFEVSEENRPKNLTATVDF